MFILVGAQVILIKTSDVYSGLVNGARGVITKFTKDNNRPVVRFIDGNEKTIYPERFPLLSAGVAIAERMQLPIDLSWGISVHKSQGMSVDKAEINLRNIFECGQAYVALSRVKSLEGLSLVYPINATQVIANPKVIEFYRKIEKRVEKVQAS